MIQYRYTREDGRHFNDRCFTLVYHTREPFKEAHNENKGSEIYEFTGHDTKRSRF